MFNFFLIRVIENKWPTWRELFVIVQGYFIFIPIVIFEDILLECKEGTRSIYWEWLKRHGAHDYISQLVKEEEREIGFTIKTQQANLVTDKINCNNLNEIVYRLNMLR